MRMDRVGSCYEPLGWEGNGADVVGLERSCPKCDAELIAGGTEASRGVAARHMCTWPRSRRNMFRKACLNKVYMEQEKKNLAINRN